MDTPVNLRVRCQKATNIRLETGAGTLLKDFTAQLEALTDVPADSMALLKGYPPKRIEYDRFSGTVADLGLKTQDTIIVELEKNLLSESLTDEGETATAKQANQTSKNTMSNTKSVISHPDMNSTSSFNSMATSETDERLGANLPSFFLGNSESGIDGTKGLRQNSVRDSTESFSSVPLASTISDSNLYNQMLAQNTHSDMAFQGMLMRHVVPADNSCLFTSVAFCLANVERIQDTNYLRELIAATVASDPEKYNEAFLGQGNSEYCKWIKRPDSWGGGIEVAILSEFYGYEITVVNIQSAGISRFGEDRNYSERMLLLYDGIHYDPLYMENFETNEQKLLFSTRETEVLDQALNLAKEAKRAHQYTDVTNFKLKCNRCNKLLTGEAEAQQHAKSTGHIDFAEIV